ncbi:MAG TPA: hypothetical protein VGO40_08610 [Longimicrobium sp.]|jgi:hypothetical protein|nr:hypothetical protein [Longimicrobium sp.]
MSSAPGRHAELDAALAALQSPRGGAPDQAAREGARDYLLAHADAAHPRLLALLEEGMAASPLAVVELLPAFGRPESVPALERLVRAGAERTSRVAAEALARHPHAAALAALLGAFSAGTAEAVTAAADGLLARGDPAACHALAAVLDHPDATTRYHVVQAAAGLGCLSAAKRAAIGTSDPDPDIRSLALGHA